MSNMPWECALIMMWQDRGLNFTADPMLLWPHSLQSQVMQWPQLFCIGWACGSDLNPKTRIGKKKNLFLFLLPLKPIHIRKVGNTILHWGLRFTLRQMSPAFKKNTYSSSYCYIALWENQLLSMLSQISVLCLTSKLSTSSCWLQSSGDQEGIKKTAQFASL